MKCPVCDNDMKVNSTRTSSDKIIRYRQCIKCNCKRITEELFRDDIPYPDNDVEDFITNILEMIKQYGFELSE